MTDQKDRGEARADDARRHDDSDIIDRMEGAPGHGDASGGNISRDVGSRDEMKQQVGEGSITRVRDSDKPEEADLPRFNQGNSKLNP
jgi:hypothetical protein